MKSVFLQQFQSLQSNAEGLITLVGDIMIVEKASPEEARTKSGIVLASNDKQINGFGANELQFYHVLMVGAGYYKEVSDPETGEIKEESVPLDVEVGDIVVLGTQSVKPISKFGPIISSKEHSLGIARADEIQIRLHGQNAPEKLDRILQGVE